MAGKAGRSGRQSGAALEVVTAMPGVAHRPEAPAHLTEAQAVEWKRVVDACPSDWFPAETHGTLESYCRHTVSERELDVEVEAAKEIQDPMSRLEVMKEYLKLRQAESRAAMSCATKLRITNQALTNHKTSRTPEDGGGAAKNPWEV